MTNGELHDGDEEDAQTEINFKPETSSGFNKEARDMEQRQYLQFQEKMLKKDAQMVELDQVIFNFYLLIFHLLESHQSQFF